MTLSSSTVSCNHSRSLVNDLRELDERLVELNEEIQKEQAKKDEFAKTLVGKNVTADKLEDTLRTLTQQINRLEKIEYPGENEREILVSLRIVLSTRQGKAFWVFS